MAVNIPTKLPSGEVATKLANPEFLKPQKSGKGGAPLIVMLSSVILFLCVCTLYYFADQRPLPSVQASYPIAPDWLWQQVQTKAQASGSPPPARNTLPRTERLENSGRRLLAPLRTTEAVLSWASMRALDAFTYNFFEIEGQLRSLRPYFTEGGWDAFQTAIERAEVREVVVAKDLLVNAIVTGDPVLIAQDRKIDGTRIWNVQVKIAVTASGGNAQTTNSKNFVVQMTIVSLPPSESIVGLAIKNFIAVPAPSGVP